MYPKPFLDYLVYFHGQRDYFECHEVLEEYWKEQPTQSRKKYWVGLIQVAVGMYHYRRSNYSGASKMIRSAIQTIEEYNEDITQLGIEVPSFLTELTKVQDNIDTKQPYKDINIPIHDEKLYQTCADLCLNSGCQWGNPSNYNDEFLIHKHKLRDRSDVIEERDYQKQLRKKK
ncbi:DUF309 domain-containing protein [Bacillus alkalicellulosilyticus]|uniref:DUF309 domain-containing protein n=1 Tax=Alkalihalobacterium alkalicellulosilyticum TaxID=1912214 RepID=UPI000998DE22|nr:DUF309 domain-containing protein [Bacillus alkalicellulosilyticus]